MRVFFEKDILTNQIASSDIFLAYEGALKHGIQTNQIGYFFDSTIDTLQKDAMIVGYIDSIIQFFKLNNITVPEPLNIHPELFSFMKRKCQIMTMGEFRKNPILPTFIKPNKDLKLFPSV
jgi:hypothetical protein